MTLSNEGEYAFRPLDIDRDQLRGFSPRECFVLGYELARIDADMARPAGFVLPVRSANAERIRKGARLRGRDISLTWMPEDRTEAWMWLRVYPQYE